MLIISKLNKIEKASELILTAMNQTKKGVRKCHANEKEILFWVSDNKEQYKHDDLRKVNSVKDAMVQIAASRIYNHPNDNPRAISFAIFNEYKIFKEAYQEFESFSRQIRRVLKCHFGHSFDNVSKNYQLLK